MISVSGVYHITEVFESGVYKFGIYKPTSNSTCRVNQRIMNGTILSGNNTQPNNKFENKRAAKVKKDSTLRLNKKVKQ